VRRFDLLLALGSLALVLAGCANSLESSWRDPATTADSLHFHKILVVAMTRDGGMRRSAEDQLVRALQESPRAKSGELTVTPSYVEVPDAKLGDVEKARATVEARGYDGVVMLTPLSAQQKITVDPPMYTPMWGYYGRAGMLYDPGSVRSDTIVRVQTNIYSVKDGKLLWSGTSRTTNPRNVERLVENVVRDVVHALRDQGLLPPAP
jgi:hypothetical protein